mmetsp:Transcript_43738/g.114042  ORF Transcript_43738/g.114042 Transcript_43738/m.114042 type:complete len:129 (+) Transcript_43738:439-825(+)
MFIHVLYYCYQISYLTTMSTHSKPSLPALFSIIHTKPLTHYPPALLSLPINPSTCRQMHTQAWTHAHAHTHTQRGERKLHLRTQPAPTCPYRIVTGMVDGISVPIQDMRGRRALSEPADDKSKGRGWE